MRPDDNIKAPNIGRFPVHNNKTAIYGGFLVNGSGGALLFRHVFIHLAQCILEALDNKGIEGQIVVVGNTVQLFHHVGRKTKGFCYGAVIAACNMKRHSFTSFPGQGECGGQQSVYPSQTLEGYILLGMFLYGTTVWGGREQARAVISSIR